MKNKNYRVKVRYFFDGVYSVKAETRDDAVKVIKENCGMVMGGSIQTTLNVDTVDWKFPIHPEVIICSVKLSKRFLRDKSNR